MHKNLRLLSFQIVCGTTLAALSTHAPAIASKLPPAINLEGAETKQDPKAKPNALFTFNPTPLEKIETENKIANLTESITRLHDRHYAPANPQQMGEEQKKLIEQAIFTVKSKQLAIYLSLRGAHYASIGETKKALNDLNEAVSSDSTSSQAYNNRAWILAQDGNFKAAMADADKAIEYSPEMPEAYDTRGTIFLALSDFDKALKDFDASIKFYPNYGEAFYHRSLALKALNRETESEKDLARAKELGYSH